jgi:legumain
MFEGLLDSNMAAYVTTAANAFESSWATYCPEFFGSTADGANAQSIPVPGNSLPAAAAAAPAAGSGSSGSSSSGSWLQMLIDGLRYAQRLVIPFTVPPQQPSSSSAAAAAAAAQDQQQQQQSGPPSPQFFTCLGDLYSVAWMEDAEASDLTHETLLQQYKSIKRRTSQNFTYDQGSHVMQYGALDIDKEVAGDYQGMMHNGSVAPTPSFPSIEWIECEQQQQVQMQQQGVSLLQRYSNAKNAAQRKQKKQQRGQAVGKTTSVLQRDADLLPLAHAAQRSTCPRRRAAAAAALRRATSARQGLEVAARAAVAALIKHADVGHVMLANLGWDAQQVLPGAQPAALHAQYTSSSNKFGSKQQQQQMKESGQGVAAVQLEAGHSSSSSSSLLGDVAGAFVEALLGPLPGREGAALVDSWDCLRGMVQVRGPCCM